MIAEPTALATFNTENPKFRTLQGRSLWVAVCILRHTDLSIGAVLLTNSALSKEAGITTGQLRRAAIELHDEGIMHVEKVGAAREYRWCANTLAIVAPSRSLQRPIRIVM